MLQKQKTIKTINFCPTSTRSHFSKLKNFLLMKFCLNLFFVSCPWNFFSRKFFSAFSLKKIHWSSFFPRNFPHQFSSLNRFFNVHRRQRDSYQFWSALDWLMRFDKRFFRFRSVITFNFVYFTFFFKHGGRFEGKIFQVTEDKFWELLNVFLIKTLKSFMNFQMFLNQ